MLSAQLTGRVDWPLAVSRLLETGAETILELGPRTVLRDLIRADRPAASATSCGAPADLAGLRRLLDVSRRRARGASGSTLVQTEEFILACLRLAIGTPCLRDSAPEAFRRTVQKPYEELVSELDAVRAAHEPPADALVVRRTAQRMLGLLRGKGWEGERSRRLLERAAAECHVEEAVLEYLV